MQIEKAAQLKARLQPQLSALGLSWLATAAVDPVEPLKQVALIGTAGSQLWPIFSASEEFADGAPHPLDRWSRRVLTDLANEAALTVGFPSDGPPYWPIISWALASGRYHQSPLGLAIHHQFGLWTSFRGLLFFEVGAAEAVALEASPCDSCVDRPCLTACPVHAFTASGYAVDACASAVASRAVACRVTGCEARLACPVGRQHHYVGPQTAFHMEHFVSAHVG